MNYNQVILCGRIKGEVKVLNHADGLVEAIFKIVVPRNNASYKKDDVFTIRCWNTLAEIARDKLQDGDLTLIDGHLKITLERITIQADRVKFLQKGELK